MVGPEDGMIPKIADFGVARFIRTVSVALTNAGTNLYMALEVKMYNDYTYPADVFSLSCMMFEIFNEQLVCQSPVKVKEYMCSTVKKGWYR